MATFFFKMKVPRPLGKKRTIPLSNNMGGGGLYLCTDE